MARYRVIGTYMESSRATRSVNQVVTASSEQAAIDEALPAGAFWSSGPYVTLLS
jgi:hypothetical protein